MSTHKTNIFVSYFAQAIRMVKMTMLDRIKSLCKERAISVTILEEKLNFPNNTIYQWKQRTPSLDKLQKVADYFNVSADYLLGRIDTPHFFTVDYSKTENYPDEIADDDFRKIERFARNLTPKDRKKALKILEATFEDAFNEDDEDEDDDI